MEKEDKHTEEIQEGVDELFEAFGPAPPAIEDEPHSEEEDEGGEKGGEKGEEEEDVRGEEQPPEEKGEKEEEEEDEGKGGEEEEEEEEEAGKKEEKEEEEKEKGESNVEKLRKIIDSLAGKVQSTTQPLAPEEKGAEKEEEEGKDKEKKEEEEEKGTEIPKFVTEAEFGDALISPQALNNLLVRVYERAIAAAREEASKVKASAVEEALLKTPGVVTKLVENKLAMERAVNDFYKQNPHLANYRQYVGVVATRLRAEHPEWDLEKLTSEVAKTASEELGLKVGSTIVNKEERKPALVKRTKGERPGSEKLSGLEKEISEMM